MTDIQADRRLEPEATLAERFSAHSDSYFWNTPSPMGWPAMLRSAQMQRQRREDRKVALPALGLVASLWFCVGLCLPGGLPPQPVARANEPHRVMAAHHPVPAMPTLIARRD